MTFRKIATNMLFFVLFCGCASTPQTVNKGPMDMSELSKRERATLERLLDEMIAPCESQAVPLAVCIEENRACSACKPAANFLADRVKAGLDRRAIRESYKLRFGDEKKTADIADSPTLGPTNAPVTIMVWSDFECPHCKHVVPIVEKVKETYRDDVRLVHKFYPIPRHTMAKVAARAAYAAQQQGKYWEMERLLFENQDKLMDEVITELATNLGLDMSKFKSDMESEAATTVISRDMADADRLGLTGTPFVLINGREFDLRLFQAELDLDAWVKTEIELVKRK